MQKKLPHLPLSETALSKSVSDLKGSGEALEGFDQGYETWRKGYDSGSAGVFTDSVQEVFVSMERIIAQQVSSTAPKTENTDSANSAVERQAAEAPLENSTVDEESP